MKGGREGGRKRWGRGERCTKGDGDYKAMRLVTLRVSLLLSSDLAWTEFTTSFRVSCGFVEDQQRRKGRRS